MTLRFSEHGLKSAAERLKVGIKAISSGRNMSSLQPESPQGFITDGDEFCLLLHLIFILQLKY